MKTSKILVSKLYAPWQPLI